MNIRWKEILEQLRNTVEPLTSVQLAANMQVSSKTVKSDMKELNLFLMENYEIEIKSTRGKGYQLVAANEEVLSSFFRQLDDQEKESNLTEPDSRVQFILEKLLLQTEYMKIDDLSNELYVSRSTLKSALKIVRENLKKYNLSIENKPNYGIKVVGSETQIRYCISEYIFHQKSLWMENSMEELNILEAHHVNKIREIFLNKIRKYKILVSDISLQNLITHFVIAYKRIQTHQVVDMITEELTKLQKTQEYAVAEEILREVEKDFEVSFSKNEVGYLAIHLLGSKLANIGIQKEELTPILDEEIQELVRNIINRIDDTFNFQLGKDQELFWALGTHLKPAINRFRYKMNLRNPMLKEIKTKYPLSFEAAIMSAEVLQEQLGIQIDENEIGYIALHLEVALERKKKGSKKVARCLVVCASGLGSSQLLQYKLEAKFGDYLHIMGVTEFYNLEFLLLHNIDFIISTIAIPFELAVPVIQISTILGDSDINKIEKLISYDQAIIEKYIRERYIYFDLDVQEPEEVLQFLCGKLTEDKKVDASYYESILKRESYSPTSFGNLVAIPHPIDPQADETFWSIAILKKPINWTDKPVQIVVLLNLNKKRKEDLLDMYKVLMKILDNQTIVNRMLQCKTIQQLKSIMQVS